jgi:catalase (peroxidase I)
MKIKRTGVFVSFASKDENIVWLLHDALDVSTWVRPIVVTRPERANPKLLNTSKVEAGIKEAHYFVPIFTRQSIAEQWINQEVGFASAFEKAFYPIVEDYLVKEKVLKGWVHPERDLPFQFTANGKVKNSSIQKCIDRVVSHIEQEELQRPVLFNEIGDYFSDFRNGKIVYFDNSSRHFLWEDKIWSLTGNRPYDFLKRNKVLEQKMAKDEFDSIPKGRLIS